jgi:hypothetical protein
MRLADHHKQEEVLNEQIEAYFADITKLVQTELQEPELKVRNVCGERKREASSMVNTSKNCSTRFAIPKNSSTTFPIHFRSCFKFLIILKFRRNSKLLGCLHTFCTECLDKSQLFERKEDLISIIPQLS